VDGIRSGVGVGTNKHGIQLICPVLLLALQYTIAAMELARAIESLKAAELCPQEGLVNSAASRAYYAMFQAAQLALEAAGLLHPDIRAHRAASG